MSLYSLEMATIPGVWRRMASICSSRTRMRRPRPRPSNGIEVRLGPRDRDAVAEAGRVLDHLFVEPAPEREQQRHGDGAPDDAEDRQQRPQLLAAHVAEELAEGFLHMSCQLSFSFSLIRRTVSFELTSQLTTDD